MKLFAASALLLAVTTAGAKKTIPLVYDKEFTGAQFEAPYFPAPSECKEDKALPNPFEYSNSTKQVKKFKDWEKRRAEIVRELYHYEVGEKPLVDKENIQATLDGRALTVVVTVNGESLTIKANIDYPEGDGPFPLMIGCSGVNLLPRTYWAEKKIATLNFNFGQVMAHQQRRGNEPINKLYPELVENGAYSMWPWGVSRIIDALEILGEQSRIDLKHIGITGCSFAGKMALWSGAFDERIALTIAQEPGGGGAAAWRVSHQSDSYRAPQGVECLDRTDKHWFLEKMWDFSGDNVYKLPMDHHELCALICPRALLVLGNTDYNWLSDEAGYVSCVAAREVWKKFGISDRMGYSIQGGHGHCQLPKSQYPEVQAFIEKFLLGDESVDTDCRHIDANIKANLPAFNIDIQSYIPWATDLDLAKD